MNRLTRPALRRPSSDDEGMILLGVMGAMIVLSLLALATLAYALQGTQPQRRDQDAKAAIAAAQAGIDDYLSRLNNDPSYYSVTSDPTNAALITTATPNPPGQNVAGSNVGGSFTYKLLTATGDTVSSGYIRIKSTGTTHGVSRTLTARLSPNSFLQYIYHTDKEDQDPVLYSGGSATIEAKCNQYYYAWGANPGRSSYSPDPCREIQFTTGDVINGPMHSNDAMQINGSVLFTDPKTETSWQTAATNKWWGSGTPSASGYKPRYAGMVTIPPSNASLLANATTYGCVYSGATKITFTSDGKMTVLSPNTAISAGCFPSGADKSIPTSGVTVPPIIYVQDSTGVCATKAGVTIRLGYPLAGELATTDSNYTGPDYACNEGTAYVSGVLNGTTTIGSSQDIVAVANITYLDQTSTSNDILGLIPTHFMWVYHPVKASDLSNMLSTPVTEIDGAILAVSDSFIVQNYNKGAAISSSSSNKLTIMGAIAQNYRGPVGTGTTSSASTGYLKNYVYDSRFARGAQPPYFLQPVSTQWTAGQVSDG
jgi:type II secretory pathway pseudopilin PulG